VNGTRAAKPAAPKAEAKAETKAEAETKTEAETKAEAESKAEAEAESGLAATAIGPIGHKGIDRCFCTLPSPGQARYLENIFLYESL
jgi:hypothetical protein